MFTNEFHFAVQMYELNLIGVTGALDKTALLLLRRVSLCVGAKANVPFAGGNKNFQFFCAWAKNKNTKQRLVGEKGVKLGQKVVLKSLIKSSQFEVARSQNRVAGNVSTTGEGSIFSRVYVAAFSSRVLEAVF